MDRGNVVLGGVLRLQLGQVRKQRLGLLCAEARRAAIGRRAGAAGVLAVRARLALDLLVDVVDELGLCLEPARRVFLNRLAALNARLEIARLLLLEDLRPSDGFLVALPVLAVELCQALLLGRRVGGGGGFSASGRQRCPKSEAWRLELVKLILQLVGSLVVALVLGFLDSLLEAFSLNTAETSLQLLLAVELDL